MLNSLKIFFVLALAALLSSGCAHYQKGDGNVVAFHSIAIAPVVNKSFAPQARTYVSESLVSTFALGGKLAVLPEDQAETVLHVTLVSYDKNIGAKQSDDTGTARSLELVLGANIVLTDATGNTLMAKSFEIHNEVYADSGATRAENQAIPAMAHALAQQIYLAVIGKW